LEQKYQASPEAKNLLMSRLRALGPSPEAASSLGCMGH
jgi:hypothetical protein